MSKLLSSEKFIALEQKQLILIDMRSTQDFCAGFIQRSVHIPFHDFFTEFLDVLIEGNNPFVLLAEKETMEKILYKTNRIGLGGFQGVVEYKQVEHLYPKDMLIDIDAEEFRIDYQFDDFYLIDVRPEDIYTKLHFEYAENIPLADIQHQITDLKTDLPFYIYGNNFSESAFAASLFKRNGFKQIRVVKDDFEILLKENIPTIANQDQTNEAHFSAN